MSPSRFSSIARSREVLPKCSACPASWKNARQSSAPPIGWITSITLSGTSIGEQKARGVFCGRCSMSSVDVLLAVEVDPEVGQRRLAAPAPSCRPGSPRPTAASAAGAARPSAPGRRARSRACSRARGPCAPRTAARCRRGTPRTAPRAPRAGSRIARRARRRSSAERGQLALRSISTRVEVDRVQVLLGRLPHARGRAARACRDRPRSPSPGGSSGRDRLAVDGHLELGLELGDLLGVLARELARGSPRSRTARARGCGGRRSTAAPTACTFSSSVSFACRS